MIGQALTEHLKKLRFSGILESYEVRLAQAREKGLTHQEWLELLVQDEVQRRDNHALAERIKKAAFEPGKLLESFDMGRYPGKAYSMMRDLTAGHYLQAHKNILLVGPTGTGKSHFAQALGHLACRQGKSVKFVRAATFFRDLQASRADKSWERLIKRFISTDVVILDDFGLTALSFMQAEDLYEIITEKYQKSSLIFTSNRKIESWLELFPDQAMGHAALDRLMSQSYAVILEGESYRRHASALNNEIQKEEDMMKNSV